MNVFQEIEERNKELVLRETFGHLAPNNKEKYSAMVIFGTDEYGNTFILKTKYGKQLPGSPWLYELEHNLAYTQGQGLYRFVGFLINNEFKGTVSKIELN